MISDSRPRSSPNNSRMTGVGDEHFVRKQGRLKKRMTTKQVRELNVESLFFGGGIRR